jgi:hypothetical protein
MRYNNQECLGFYLCEIFRDYHCLYVFSRQVRVLINIFLTFAYFTWGIICAVEVTNRTAISVPICLDMGVSYRNLCFVNLKQAEKGKEKQHIS